jgi:hypothetical protein
MEKFFSESSWEKNTINKRTIYSYYVNAGSEFGGFWPMKMSYCHSSTRQIFKDLRYHISTILLKKTIRRGKKRSIFFFQLNSNVKKFIQLRLFFFRIKWKVSALIF